MHNPENLQGSPEASRLASLRRALLKKRRQFEECVSSLSAARSWVHDRDVKDDADLAAATLDSETSCTLDDIMTESVAGIDEALDKIEKGTYGVCEGCGGAIPAARLEAMPSASLCVACKELEESGGTAPRRSPDGRERTAETVYHNHRVHRSRRKKSGYRLKLTARRSGKNGKGGHRAA